MNTLPSVVTNSKLWRETLAPRENDPFGTERERFRTVFKSFRERAGHLANQIRTDCPMLTVHDLTHLDALWEMAAVIAGENYVLTPTEGFVLGGAILLHDLAMSTSAIDGGYNALKRDPRWTDIITSEYQSRFERRPTIEELKEPAREIETTTLFILLRQIHAENAERLAFLEFRSGDRPSQMLIEDTEIRQTFGRIIGRIAHSHWWSLDEVERAFSRQIGAPAWCPPDWLVDPLKIACILRAADAAQVDARRAPVFLKAISKLPTASEAHWRFQEKLNKPYLNQDALVFTASAFKLADAGAWWLCLETLRMVDRELRSVDALFADKRLNRFAARRVAAVDSPERLASYIQTDGLWCAPCAGPVTYGLLDLARRLFHASHATFFSR